VLIYENGTLRIADFGCARKVDLPSNNGINNSGGAGGAGAGDDCDEDDMPPSCPTPLTTPSLTASLTMQSPPPISISTSPMVHDSVGTEVFYSPEICQGNGYDIFQADIWAAGCCLCCFTNEGMIPFDPRLPYDALIKSILNDPPSLYSKETPPSYFHHTTTVRRSASLSSSSSSDVLTDSPLYYCDGDGDSDSEMKGNIDKDEVLKSLILGLLNKDTTKRMTLEDAEQHKWLSNLPPDLPPTV
jgi:serine/threonine protein kinase